MSEYKLVRYCYECGSIGDIREGYRDCCPDGNHAVVIHEEIAKQAHAGFKAMLAAAPEPAQLPKDELRDDATAAFPCPCGCGDQGEDLLTELLKVTPEPAPQDNRLLVKAFHKVQEFKGGAAPLPDDVAAMVRRLNRVGSPMHLALEAADMLERLARELAAVKVERDALIAELEKTTDESLEQAWSERNEAHVQLHNCKEVLSAVKAENEKLRKEVESWKAQHSIAAQSSASYYRRWRNYQAENNTLLKDADRYKKLRGWMSSNVKEGWDQVERLGAVAAWQGWDDFDNYLDSLTECNCGLMYRRADDAAIDAAMKGGK